MSDDHRFLVETMREAVFEGDLLNEKEREVLITTMEYYKPEEEHQWLPNGVAEELGRRLGVQVESITQIRRRAYRKIRTFVEEQTLRRVEAAS